MTRLTFLKKCVKGTNVELEGTHLEKGQSLHPVRLAISFFFAKIYAVGTQAQDAASPKFTLFAGPGIVAADGSLRGEIQAGASFDDAKSKIISPLEFRTVTGTITSFTFTLIACSCPSAVTIVSAFAPTVG